MGFDTGCAVTCCKAAAATVLFFGCTQPQWLAAVADAMPCSLASPQAHPFRPSTEHEHPECDLHECTVTSGSKTLDGLSCCSTSLASMYRNIAATGVTCTPSSLKDFLSSRPMSGASYTLIAFLPSRATNLRRLRIYSDSYLIPYLRSHVQRKATLYGGSCRRRQGTTAVAPSAVRSG